MRALFILFILTNCLNLEPKADAQALNMQYSIPGDYLLPPDGQTPMIAANPGLMGGQINRGMFPLMPVQMGPIGQGGAIMNRRRILVPRGQGTGPGKGSVWQG